MYSVQSHFRSRERVKKPSTVSKIREALSMESGSKQRLDWYQDGFLLPGRYVHHNRNWWEIKTLSGRYTGAHSRIRMLYVIFLRQLRHAHALL